MTAIVLALCAFAALMLALHLGSIALAALRCRPGAPPPTPHDAPAISVVRPLRGVEPFSAQTLEAALRLDWPVQETLFCVADRDDPVIPLVRRALAAHPHVDARLLIGADGWTANPKLDNMTKGFREARHPLIVFTDSNLLTPPDYLRRLHHAWTQGGPRIGVVTAPPAGAAPQGFWAHVECAMLNTWQTRVQYAVDTLGFGFAQGKTLMFGRADLDRGGFTALADEPAEDAAATKFARRRGQGVRLVGPPFPQMLGPRSAGDVWSRHLRWARLRRATFPLLFVPEIAAGAMPPALALGVAAGLAGWAVAPLVLVYLIAWYAAEAALARLARWPLDWRAPLAFLARDLMLPVLWGAALSGRSIVWRGREVSPTPRKSALRLLWR